MARRHPESSDALPKKSKRAYGLDQYSVAQVDLVRNLVLQLIQKEREEQKRAIKNRSEFRLRLGLPDSDSSKLRAQFIQEAGQFPRYWRLDDRGLKEKSREEAQEELVAIGSKSVPCSFDLVVFHIEGASTRLQVTIEQNYGLERAGTFSEYVIEGQGHDAHLKQTGVGRQ